MVESWETVSVTLLPDGWRNLYKLDGGKALVSRAPAILLQEMRGEWIYDGQERIIAVEGPLQTRVVFADTNLEPVTESSNYWMTIGPGESMPRKLTDDYVADVVEIEGIQG